MGKWIGGIVGTVIAGAVLWFLTNALFPQWFLPRPAPQPVATVRVACSANPATVRPGGDSEISVTVTRGGEPVEGAAVKLDIGGGLFGSGTTTTSGRTYSGGVFRTTWRAPSPSAAGYVFPAEVNLEGLPTAQSLAQTHYRTNCEILVSP
jgi:hypothetical protein